MTNFNKFEPAFTRPIKWSVSENNFDDSDMYPKSLSLFVPIESIQDLTNHLMSLMDEPSKLKKGKVWDFAKKEEVEVEGIYLNAKGKAGDYGDFGNINPKKITHEVPF
tara:strand:+ start:1365 stop:1688 length:324 start_codon:yes stop_codon:yes gene_type:complete